jgi:hypothetical protein
MKHLILLLIIVATITSCRKKYNCYCSTTVVNGYINDFHVSRSKPMSEKMTKKQAKAVCDHEAESINDTYTNLFTNSGTQSSSGWVATTYCKVE